MASAADAPASTTLSDQSSRTRLGALSAGLACLALVGGAVATAWPDGSPLVPEHAAPDGGWAWVYLAFAVAAFAAYLIGLFFLSRARMRAGAVITIACAVQLVPLAGPVLLSTDVYAYWDYGRIAAVHGANPYVEEPRDFPGDPAFSFVGADLRDTTSVYGPGFTLASEAHALAAGESKDAAAWLYKGLAAAAMVALVALAARLGSRPAYAAAFVGWNPLLALHFAGGGHNDVWMMAFVLGAMTLAGSGRRGLAGAAWAIGVAVKWVPLMLLPLRFLEARRAGRPVQHLGFAAAAGIIVAIATWRYGLAWLGAFGPIGRNIAEERAAYSIPSRVSEIGIPVAVAAVLFAAAFAFAYLWLLREASRGRARLGLSAGLLLVATSWLRPWYIVWVVPLAAVEEDRAARWLALALSAYLLRDAVPL